MEVADLGLLHRISKEAGTTVNIYLDYIFFINLFKTQ